jgi:hypothetical protein
MLGDGEMSGSGPRSHLVRAGPEVNGDEGHLDGEETQAGG